MDLWFISALLIIGVGVNGLEDCGELQSNDVYPRPLCFNTQCTSAIKNHIKYEFHAAFKYLYMGALFGQYIVERPGMSKFFLESATEERGHAIQMMDYLNMRGIKYTENYEFTSNMLWKPNRNHIIKEDLRSLSIESALKEALEMEIEVTKKINEVVERCGDDFHAADVFTAPILEEQHTGLRKLQGAIKVLKNIQGGHTQDETEYIFDLKMLNGEV